MFFPVRHSISSLCWTFSVIFLVFLSFQQEEGTWASHRLIPRFSVCFILCPFPNNFSIFLPTSDHWDHIFIAIHIILLRSCPWGTRDHYFNNKVRIVFLMCTTNELVHPSAMNFVCHSNVQPLSLVRVFCSSAPQPFVFTALNNLVPSVNFIISIVYFFPHLVSEYMQTTWKDTNIHAEIHL